MTADSFIKIELNFSKCHRRWQVADDVEEAMRLIGEVARDAARRQEAPASAPLKQKLECVIGQGRASAAANHDHPHKSGLQHPRHGLAPSQAVSPRRGKAACSHRTGAAHDGCHTTANQIGIEKKAI
ncbi:MAG: hypothetical protein ACREVE_00550 [Gammaproteobacteria bacterium]